MTATKQNKLITALIDTKKYKYGRLPKVKDAVNLLQKVDKTVWASIDAKFDAMVAWCEQKDLL